MTVYSKKVWNDVIQSLSIRNVTISPPGLACYIALASLITSATAQWLDYPTPGVPKTADGKPNLSAPAPRTGDGKPDLSGLWEMERKGRLLADIPGGESVNLEFVNIGSRRKESLP